MLYNYYPGCTLKSGGRRFDICSRLAFRALGAELCELDEWQCCGGICPSAKNETAPKLPAVRALNKAKEGGGDLATVCSSCYHVLKSVNYDMKNDPYAREKINSYLGIEPEYKGETRVRHYLEIMRDDIAFEKVAENVKNPLNMKIAPYYGCLLLRPSRIMDFDDPENPRIMEDFISSLGGSAVAYPLRNECCGGYITAEDKSVTQKKCTEISENALSHGAELIVTACPLCYYNLNKYGCLPVKFFTEILCEALGIEVTDGD